MGATHASSSNKTLPAVEKGSLPELLNRLPPGSTLMPALILYGNEQEIRRRWEIKHDKLNFWVVRDTPEEAIRSFLHAVDKRGLRPMLEGIAALPLNSQPKREPGPIVAKPVVV